MSIGKRASPPGTPVTHVADDCAACAGAAMAAAVKAPRTRRMYLVMVHMVESLADGVEGFYSVTVTVGFYEVRWNAEDCV